MIKFFLPLLAIIFLLDSCTGEQKSFDFFTRIKTLEYSRESDSAQWETLYGQLKTDTEKQVLLNSIAKTKNASCVSFLGRVLRHSLSDSLRKEAVFALGQTQSRAAEEILLQLPFDSLSVPLQKELLFALSQCGSEHSVSFLKRCLRNQQLPNQTLITLAHLWRKGIGRAYFPADSSGAISYYLSNAATFGHIPLTISLLSGSSRIQTKYLFKTLSKLAGRDSSRFRLALLSDSLTLPGLRLALRDVLTKRTHHSVQLYAIPLVPFARDSVLTARLSSFLTSENPHLFLSAVKASVVRASVSEATSLLLALFGDEKNPFLRAQMLKILAGVNNRYAYRIIMQDLDRGSDRYKIALLEALAQTAMKPAFRTIRQFLAVPNPQLANTAFELLARRGRIHKKDIKRFLSSDAFSSVSIALEESKKTKLKMPPAELLRLYKKFNSADAFEVQKSVLRSLSQKTLRQDSVLQKQLWEQASHPVIQRLLEQKYPSVYAHKKTAKKYLNELPAFLSPDSLSQERTNPRIIIKTSRGEITAELFAIETPLTVRNFIRLAKTGFYEHLDFHRVIADFVIQGGDPLGDGWGGTAYLVPSEDNDIPFEQGSLGIATSGFDTGSCQFFICLSAQPHLTGNYTNFGRVIKGRSVVDHILPGDKILSIHLIDGTHL